MGHALERAVPVAADGRFAFSGGFAARARGRALDLHVLDDGHVDRIVPVSIPGEVIVRLERGLEIRGRTVFPDGSGYAGATVEVTDESGERSTAWAQADSQGHFRVAGLTSQLVRVDISAPCVRAAPRVVPAGTDLGEVVMGERLARVRFRVWSADGGELSPGDLVVVRAGEDTPPASTRLWSAQPTPTPLADVRSDWLEIEAPGRAERLELHVDGYDVWRSRAFPLHDAEGATEIEVALTPTAAALTVRFEDESGAPVAIGSRGGLLVVTGSSGVLRRRVLTSGTGRLRVTGLPNRRLRLDVFGDTRRGTAVWHPASAAEALSVVLEATGTLDVAFPGAAETGVAFTLVRDGPEGNGAMAKAVEFGVDGQQSLAVPGESLPEGRFLTDRFAALPDGRGTARRRIEGLRPGRYRLRVRDTGGDVWVEVRAGEVTEAVIRGD
ncbi:MAG: carboxypeptidase-like regulatory domain-containing protein [Planctomycetota bacterium]